eukprot:m.130800 g.130800  ORF g.130800 m.130800 type:complete len:60 (-) comp14608_c0_seq9:1216-1395(-)
MPGTSSMLKLDDDLVGNYCGPQENSHERPSRSQNLGWLRKVLGGKGEEATISWSEESFT